MSIFVIPSAAALVLSILTLAFIMILVGDLSLITPTDLRVNWAPVAPKEVFNKTKEVEVNQWDLFEDPTEVVEPKNVKAAPKEFIVEENQLLPDGSIWVTITKVVAPTPLEVAEISLRGLGRGVFGRPEAVYFV